MLTDSTNLELAVKVQRSDVPESPAMKASVRAVLQEQINVLQEALNGN